MLLSFLLSSAERFYTFDASGFASRMGYEEKGKSMCRLGRLYFYTSLSVKIAEDFELLLNF